MCVCVCVCACVCACVCMCMCMNTTHSSKLSSCCADIHVCVGLCVCIPLPSAQANPRSPHAGSTMVSPRARVCVCVCVYEKMPVAAMCVCLCAYVRARMYVRAHASVHACARVGKRGGCMHSYHSDLIVCRLAPPGQLTRTNKKTHTSAP